MTAADYAAIAVAPVLIFVMISSLANFLMLTLYHGPYPDRVAWIVLMFTMGFVGIARIAIEQSRAHSLGYAVVLGIAGFISMSTFVGSPIFSAFILAVIAYLADRVVDDCTLIDDSVDSSGQGLVDFGKGVVKEQIELAKAERMASSETANPPSLDDEESEGTNAGEPTVKPRRGSRGRKSQPGRTVMYLALAALPLFGFGQFMLRGDSDTWQRAQWFLATYLFSSFSLLVTTSFLGLRRYLRQRGVDMPANVSVGWLAGGVAMTAAIISLAYLVPMPGKAIASIRLPDFLNSPDDLSASRFGWGNEGAQESKESDAKTSEDRKPEGKQEQGMQSRKGAKPGDSGDGDRKDGPAGKKDGGKQQSGDKNTSDSKSKSSKQSGEKQSGKGETSKGKKQTQQEKQQSEQGKQESGNQQSGKKQGEQKQGEQSEKQSSESPQAESRKDDSSAESNEDKSSSSKQNESDSKSDSGDESDESSEADDSDSNEDASEGDSETNAEQSAQNDSSSNSSSSNSQPSEPPSRSSSSTSMFGGIFSAVGNLFRFLFVAVLVAIVCGYLWINREAIMRWWNSLWDRPVSEADKPMIETIESDPSAPPRPFSSFRNPIGREKDPRRIMVITFQAFEAWTRENGWTREKDETPSEFIQRVAGSLPQMSTAATSVVGAYNRIVYGRGRPTQSDIDAAKAVWQAMS